MRIDFASKSERVIYIVQVPRSPFSTFVGSLLLYVSFVLADAAWESFADKKEVTSANQEHMIQKVLQNLHWERKPRGGGRDDEDDWDRSRRRRAMVVDDDDDDVLPEDAAVGQSQRRS